MNSIKKLFNWELAWSKSTRRWYYQDRKSGEAQWTVPRGCPLDGEKVEPPKEWPKDPYSEFELDDDWEALWDPQQKRYYFYNVATRKRTWNVPKKVRGIKNPDQEDEEDESEEDSQASDFFALRTETERVQASVEQHIKSQPSLKRQGSMVQKSLLTMAKHQVEISNERKTGKSQLSPRKHSDSPAVKAIKASQQQRPKKTYNTDLTQLLWDPHTFKERLRENDAYPLLYKKSLAELKENNDTFLKHTKMSIPVTTRVTYHQCEEAVIAGEMETYDDAPTLTVSHKTIAEAAAFFALDSRRVVVCLNFSGGQAEFIGGGYIDGGIDPERDYQGDLCRRIPNLHPSLVAAASKGLYPFGPSTCADPAEPAQYSSVLYTPSVEVDHVSGIEKSGLNVARAGLDRGFAIYTKELQQRKVGVVSAAAPKKFRFGQQVEELWDHKLVANTITSIFMAPVIEEPRVTTLVLGMWGVSAYANPEMMGTLFGEKIARGSQVTVGAAVDQDDAEASSYHVKLGHLYHEIHFAVPIYNDADEKQVDGFIRGLAKSGLDITGVPALGEARLEAAKPNRSSTRLEAD